MSPTGDFIATGGSSGILRIYRAKYQNNNLNSVSLEKEIAMHSAQINSVGFGLKGEYVFSASIDKTCRIYSTKDWKQLRCLSLGLPNLNTKLEFRVAAFDPKLNSIVTLAAATRKETYLTFWNASKDFDPIDTIRIHETMCQKLSIGSSGKIALGANDGNLIIFDTKYFLSFLTYLLENGKLYVKNV